MSILLFRMEKLFNHFLICHLHYVMKFPQIAIVTNHITFKQQYLCQLIVIDLTKSSKI
jgi:hypothetical protein